MIFSCSDILPNTWIELESAPILTYWRFFMLIRIYSMTSCIWVRSIIHHVMLHPQRIRYRRFWFLSISMRGSYCVTWHGFVYFGCVVRRFEWALWDGGGWDCIVAIDVLYVCWSIALSTGMVYLRWYSSSWFWDLIMWCNIGERWDGYWRDRVYMQRYGYAKVWGLDSRVWDWNGLGLGLMIAKVEENLQIVYRRLIDWNGMEWNGCFGYRFWFLSKCSRLVTSSVFILCLWDEDIYVWKAFSFLYQLHSRAGYKEIWYMNWGHIAYDSSWWS